jgi:CRISPR-associated protein Csd1
MILQALHQLYENTPALARRGYAPMGISWVIALTLDGEIGQIRDFKSKSQHNSKMVPQDLVVPTVGKRTSGDKPIFLCDKSDYVLGRNYESETTQEERQKLARRFDLFRTLHFAAKEQIKHPHYTALIRFLENWKPFSPEAVETLESKSGQKFADLSVGNFAFMIVGEPNSFLHDLTEATTYWNSTLDKTDEAIIGLCLVTGKYGPIARLHPAIKGVIDPGGQAEKGIVVINKDKTAFTSYGKEQSFNAPVSEDAAFAYCTALNYLLASDRQRFRVGDTSTVFWTEAPTPAEDLLPFLIDSGKTTEDEALKQRLAGVIERIAAGNLDGDDLGDAKTRFYILGLAPNASRLSVRFWHTSTLGDLAANLQKHHHDLAIERQWDETNSKNPEPQAPGIYALLKQTARDADGIPPLLGGALIRAILLGTKYPDALFQKVMSRVRVAEKDKNDNPVDRVGYLRASIIKAYLNRNHNQNLTMSLDTTRTDTAYLLGRLFAVLEKTQQDALPDINTTIRDRFYSAASATPSAVFARILRTYQHHLGKLEGGYKVNRERLVQDIMSGMTSFPAHLNLQQQGQFAIGYYHQRKDFFTKKDKPETAQE